MSPQPVPSRPRQKKPLPHRRGSEKAVFVHCTLCRNRAAAISYRFFHGAILEEHQPIGVTVELDREAVVASQLAGCDEVRYWMDDQPLDRPFQMAGAIP